MFKTEISYRKLRFQNGTTGYEDELWITFCVFDDNGSTDSNDWNTSTEDIDEARDGTDFKDNRAKWETGEHITMTVAKR